jgi:hypothetical protein
MKSLFALGLNLLFLSFYALEAAPQAKISYCDQAEDTKPLNLEKLGEFKINQGRLYKKNKKDSFDLVPNTFDLKKVFNHRDELIALQCDGDLFHYDQQRQTWRKLKTNVYDAKSARNYLFAIAQNDLFVATHLYLLQEDASIFRFIQNNISGVEDSAEGLVFFDLQGEHQIVKAEHGTLVIKDENIAIDDTTSDYQYRLKSLRLLSSFEQNFLGGENDVEMKVLDSKLLVKVSDSLIGKKILLNAELKKLLQVKSEGLSLPFQLIVKEKDLWEEQVLMSESKMLKLDQANFLNGKEILKVSNEAIEVEIEIFKR